jgi:hypothetical protein
MSYGERVTLKTIRDEHGVLPVGTKVRIAREWSLATTLWGRVVTIKTATRDEKFYSIEYTFDEIPFTLLDREVSVVPVVGMPATYSINGDSYADEVEAVSPSGKMVTLRQHGKATLRQDGHFRPAGSSYSFVSFGFAQERRDPSF